MRQSGDEGGVAVARLAQVLKYDLSQLGTEGGRVMDRYLHSRPRVRPRTSCWSREGGGNHPLACECHIDSSLVVGSRCILRDRVFCLCAPPACARFPRALLPRSAASPAFVRTSGQRVVSSPGLLFSLHHVSPTSKVCVRANDHNLTLFFFLRPNPRHVAHIASLSLTTTSFF